MTDNLYDYVFWYNTYEKYWYAIPTKHYTSFFAGKKSIPGVFLSKDVTTLMDVVMNNDIYNQQPS